MKKLLIIIISLILICIIAYIFLLRDTVEGFEITIKNSSQNTVKGIFLTCYGIQNDIEVPILKPQEEKVIKVQPKDYDENHISLYYKNKNGEKEEHIIVGYFEESYGDGYAVVKIEEVTKSGLLKISSKYRYAGYIGMSEWY